MNCLWCARRSRSHFFMVGACEVDGLAPPQESVGDPVAMTKNALVAAEPSPAIQQEPSSQSLKQQLLDESHLTTCSSERPQIYQLRKRQTMHDAVNLVRKFEVGDDSGKDLKVFMVLGVSGAGKTTFLNGFMNYIAGVNWDDSFRFRLVDETCTDHNQAHSQTSWVTAYVIYWREGSCIPFTVVLIDTPGYGDTRGVDRDLAITAQIRAFFGSDSSAGIVEEIHAVGLVVPATVMQLTSTQQFICNSVLGLFGKDITASLLVLATFADTAQPRVLAALREAGVPYSRLLKFNNSALFAPNVPPNTDMSEEQEEDLWDGDDGLGVAKMFWELGISSYKTFAKALQDMPGWSLDMTRMVLALSKLIEDERMQHATTERALSEVRSKADALMVQQAVYDPPHYWIQRGSLNTSSMSVMRVRVPEKDREFFELLMSTREHAGGCGQSIDSRFLANVIRVQVWRLENPILWHQYRMRAMAIKRQHETSNIHCDPVQPSIAPHAVLDGSINEVMLWHGTSQKSLELIRDYGFDERVCKLKGRYGAGLYFASQSCKAGQYASGVNNSHAFLYCRVLLGSPCYMTKTMPCERRPPEYPSNPGLLYDSVVVNGGQVHSTSGPIPQLHREFVVYDKLQAYPEFEVEVEATS